MRRTKIVCTLGPATDDIKVLREMALAGMNVARLNFSHDTYENQARRINAVKTIRKELGMPIAIMLDTKGPEVRVKTFENGKTVLQEGQTFTFCCGEDIVGNNERVGVSFSKLPKYLKNGDRILLNDGLISVKVKRIVKNEVECEVLEGGELTNRKSLNFPGIHIDMPYLSEQDRADILFGIKEGVEYVAASFVRNENDIKIIRNLLDANGGEDLDIIAKIENREGVNNIDKIIAESNGIMVARGDMGVEIPFEELPAIQKEIIRKCYRAGKKVITATQMLESMIVNPRPTRAEISDVANAVYDGTSATMLSGETAIGRNPVEVIRTMGKIIEQTESKIDYVKRFYETSFEIKTISDAISHATCSAAHDLNCRAIIVVTQTGTTARKISRFRPFVPIVAATTSENAYNKLSINWGVFPATAVMQPSTDELFAHAVERAKSINMVKSGDLAVIAAGIPVGIAGNSNILKIETID